MLEIFRRIKAEILIFLTIYSGWLLYALTADIYYRPVGLDAQTLLVRMFYVSVETYFVVAVIRFTAKSLKNRDDEEGE